MSILFLIGMPGAGKTYWGNKLHKEYGYRFTDLDTYIEQKLQQTINAIFEQHGEQYFRQQETDALHELIASTSQTHIISTGGGTPIYNNNIQAMRGAGCVVYLKVSLAALNERLKADNSRPLLRGNPDVLQSLTNMLAARQKIYEQADHILDADNISLTNFEKIITTCIGQP